MDILDTIAVSDNFDIIIEDTGMIRMDVKSASVADRIKFELSSNNSWKYDSSLGINWVDEFGTGLLQYKDSGPAIVSALEKKLNTISGVKEIKEITLNPVKERGMQVYIVVTTDLDEDIAVVSEV